MATSKPSIVAPSFSQNDEMDADQFAGMEEDFNDDDQFEEFSMDQDYGMPEGYEWNQKGRDSADSNDPAAKIFPQASKTSASGWSTIKFNTNDFPGVPKPDNKTRSEDNQFPAVTGSLENELDQQSDFDYQNYEDQGYDDNLTADETEYHENEKNSNYRNDKLQNQGSIQDRNSSNSNYYQNQSAINKGVDQFRGEKFTNYGEVFPNQTEDANYDYGTGISQKETFDDLAEPQSFDALVDEMEPEGAQEMGEDADQDEDNDDEVGGEGDDDEYEDDAESDGEGSEDVSDDEDISEALNSLGDLDAGMFLLAINIPREFNSPCHVFI